MNLQLISSKRSSRGSGRIRTKTSGTTKCPKRHPTTIISISSRSNSGDIKLELIRTFALGLLKFIVMYILLHKSSHFQTERKNSKAFAHSHIPYTYRLSTRWPFQSLAKQRNVNCTFYRFVASPAHSVRVFRGVRNVFCQKFLVISIGSSRKVHLRW